jgi:hypothetical protein
LLNNKEHDIGYKKWREVAEIAVGGGTEAAD